MKLIAYYFKSFSILFCFLSITTCFYAQSINTGTVSSTLICRGSSITVNFFTTGSFQGGGSFRLQLSNSSGNFNSNNYIGELVLENSSSGNNNAARTITGNIPNSISTGNVYRVRVVFFDDNENRLVVGNRNNKNIRIVSSKLTPTFSLATSICSGTNLTLPTTSTNSITGTWSPAFNPTQTTTYTFTPTAGLCANSVIRTITVNEKATPTFTLPTAICSGTNLSLPTTSTNSITGTWSPAFNTTQTTTYTFTPTAGLCANTVTRTITVNAKETPTFNLPTAICSGTNLTLPTTSTNSITGTWSPAFNATQTTTYTFTPTSGLCANTVTKTITVNTIVTPTFSIPTPICSGTNLTLPTTSTNSIIGTWSPAMDNEETTTYTFTPEENSCATSIAATVVVNPLVIPSFSQIAPICLGENVILPLASENGINGSWSPAINNQETTTYNFTPEENTCATSTSMSVIVNPLTIPSFSQIAPICSGENVILPLASENGISGSWSPAINNQETTTYLFSPNEGACATTISQTLVVNPNISIDTNVTALFTYTWPVNGETYTESGLYTHLNNCVETKLYLTIIENCNLETPSVITGTSIGICLNGITNPSYSIAAINGATSYEWIAPVGTEIISGQGTTSITLNVLENFTDGNLSVRALNICDTSQSRTLFIRSVFYTPLTPLGSTTGLCTTGLSTVVYNAAIVSGVTNYMWSVPEGTTIISGQGTNVIALNITDNFSIGSLKLTMTNSCGESPIRGITLRSTLTQPGVISGPTTGLCTSGISTATYSIAAVVGATNYTWTAPNGTVIQSGQGTTSIVLDILDGFTIGNLSVVANNDCGSGIARTLSIRSTLTQPGIISGPTTGLCTQGISTATYSIIAVAGATSYTWSAPIGTSITSGQGSNSIELTVLEGFTSGSLTVVANNDCGSSLQSSLSIRSTLSQSGAISGMTTGLCPEGASLPTYTIAAVAGATSYTWTATEGTTIVSGQGTNAIELSVLEGFTSGCIKVVANNDCGSSVARTLSIRSTLTQPGVISGPTTGLCSQGISTATYSISAVAGATNYTWTVPTGTAITSGQGSNSIELIVLDGFTSGNLSVVANNDCGSGIARTLSIRSTLTQPGIISGTTTGLCTQGTSTATYSIAAVAGATNYTWTVPTGTAITSGQGSNSIELIILEGFTSGTLSVVANNDCGSGIARTLSIRSTLTQPGIISGTTTGLCTQGTSTATYSIAAIAGATSYTWTAPVGTTIVSGQGSNSIELIVLEGFTYGSLSVVANNNCGSSLQSSLSIRSTLSQTGVISGINTGLCPEGISLPTYSIPAVVGASSYTWTAPAGTTIVSGQGTRTITLSISSSFTTGALTVVASNQCGNSPIRMLTLSSTPLTPTTITGSITPCGTETYTCATVAQAISYTWTVPVGMEIVSGQGTNSITVNVNTSAVTGSVTVRASNNCKTGNAKSLVVNSCNTNTKIAEIVSNQPKNEIEVLVYPNPTKDIVNIELSKELDENLNIQIINLIGQKVSEIEIKKGFTIDNATLDGMPSGIYLLQATKSNGQLVYSTKVIKY